MSDEIIDHRVKKIDRRIALLQEQRDRLDSHIQALTDNKDVIVKDIAQRMQVSQSKKVE